jgi:O-antigen/teichoic acid export membrane protein
MHSNFAVQEPPATEPVATHKVAVAMGTSTLFGVLASVAQAGTRVFTVPIVIAHLGLDGYGIWSIIMTTGAYMRFGTAGLKSAFQKYVAEALGNGNFQRVNQLISTGSAAMLCASVLGLLPIAIFARALAWHSGVPPRFIDSTAGSFTLLALLMIISNFAAVYEAIVAGANHIELLKKFNIVQAVVEAIAIIVCLRLGYGLLAMTAVMAASEVGLIICCYIASHRLLPQVRLGFEFITRSVVGELVRFAGSYQVLNVLEILYNAILPLFILKLYGAAAAGVFALCIRLASTAVMFQESSLLPLLSSGAMVYALGTGSEMRLLVNKAFKWTLVMSIPPLAFVSIFGTTIILAWTGTSDHAFTVSLLLVCVAALFRAISRAGFILYRVTGGNVNDIIRQLICIAPILLVAFFGHQVGYFGMLAATAAGELLGMVFMVGALRRAMHGFDLKALLPDALKLIMGAAAILAVGALAGAISGYWDIPARSGAGLRLFLAVVGSALMVRPALALTKFLSAGEQRAIVDVLLRRGRKAMVAQAQA